MYCEVAEIIAAGSFFYAYDGLDGKTPMPVNRMRDKDMAMIFHIMRVSHHVRWNFRG